ncbi:MAG TPA: DnaJ domain-containing protein [Stellaceae bacterium]|nr:DnaJ domain-containing protein [Stellaceae bacterium]
MSRPRYDFDASIRTHGGRPHGSRAGLRHCDMPGCENEGQFRAPRSRDALDSYYWFCLDHVRAYNASWNYYAGMNENQIEAEIRRDTVWQRPTWPMGWRMARDRTHDPFGFMNDGGEAAPERKQRVLSPEESALQLFDLAMPFTLTELKRRYKVLVKLHHPDSHGGDKAAEEKLKTVIQAYALLKPLALS